VLSSSLAVQEPPSAPTRPGPLVMLRGSREAAPDSFSRHPASNAARGLPSREGDTVGVAVIGLGDWGPNLLRVLAENPDAEVRWICDLDRERLAEYHRRYPAARVTTRLGRVLADPGVEAVIIATPVYTHYEMAAEALGAGKHVFVENPLAHSSDLADDLAQMARARDRVLMCGHTFVYSPPVRAVKRMVEARTLGEIYCISSSRVNSEVRQRDVSVIWDLGPHDFSILLYWLSEMPTAVRALGRDSIVKGIADVAFVTLSFASGIVANIELSRLAPSKLRRTVLVGREQMAIYDDSPSEPVRLLDPGVACRDPETFGEYHPSYRTGNVLSPQVETYEPLGLELADFVDAVRANGRMEFHTTLARSVVRIVEAADRSLAAGGDEVAVDHAGLAAQATSRPALALA
jgi:predicted dehydrogenase